MKDTALYEQLLGLKAPWSVKRVEKTIRSRGRNQFVKRLLYRHFHLLTRAGQPIDQRIQAEIRNPAALRPSCITAKIFVTCACRCSGAHSYSASK